MTIDTVYMDMDGVLVDLEKILASYEGTPMEEIRSQNPDVDVVIKLINKHIDKEPFFHADPMPEEDHVYEVMRRLSSDDYRVIVLTSGTKNAEIYPRVVEQKQRWLHKHDYSLYPAIFAKGGSTKAECANERAVLIDDYLPNLEKFKAAGGHTIHYVPGMDLMDELLKFGIDIK